MKPSSLRCLAVGNTSVVYAWEQGHVVKVFGAGIPAHWACLEAESTRLVHAAGLPVPEVFDVIEMHGRPAIAYERVVGKTML